VGALTKRKKSLGIILSLLLITSISLTIVPVSESRASISSASIEVEGFRWTNFPIKILVDMNQWSTPDYASAVHEAVETWLLSIRTYSSSYNDTTLTVVDFKFYVSNVNATNNYDVFITFTANEISQNAVGLTSYQWNPISHEPRLPVTINLTTYSRTASHLFVKNIVMHEFGHALGLGHASSRDTQNGPELMYFESSTDQIIYPSTLDIFGLIMVYRGNYKQSVQLPTYIPYEMVQPTTDVPSNPKLSLPQLVSGDLFETIFKEFIKTIQQVWQTEWPIIILIIILLVFISCLIIVTIA
jgi:predicted Zn-dependent protease